MLNELKLPTEQSLTNLDKELIIPFLNRKGYKQIGEGFFSKTFAKLNSTGLLKISTKQDSGWLNFIDICDVHYNNQHLLKVSKVITYSENNNLLFMAFMEKLKKIPPSVYTNLACFMITFCSDYLPSYILSGYRFNVANLRNRFELAEKFNETFPDFLPTIKLIYNKKRNNILDLHSDNIMMRNNIPVIIDPYANPDDI